jgi:hypothetical protein
VLLALKNLYQRHIKEQQALIPSVQISNLFHAKNF